MLHNPTYNFDDALIPIGGSMWVRLVEAWFNERGSAHGIS
jgi:metal-dependent amidase/aminoacylase/carboxypeptidase family protein